MSESALQLRFSTGVANRACALGKSIETVEWVAACNTTIRWQTVMADSEFEEFRHIFDKLPQHIKAPTPFYSLVPNVGFDAESPTSSKSGDSPTEGVKPLNRPHNTRVNSEEDDQEDATKSTRVLQAATAQPNLWPNSERRRRKLPEIPKNLRPSLVSYVGNTHSATSQGGPVSLADELNGMDAWPTRSMLVMKCRYILDEDSSPDSDRVASLADADSGHSTAHSPIDGAPKSLSPPPGQIIQNVSPSSSCSMNGTPFLSTLGSDISYCQLEMLEATHRGLHKFNARHPDEVEIEIGDPIYVQKEADDLWCEGVNLRTGRHGIFPSAYAVDMEYNDFDPSNIQAKRERYLLGYMGSVETVAHKGTGVVCQAVKKIISDINAESKAQPCILEVSDQGLRMVDRSKPEKRPNQPCLDYFYSLKNVSFCAFHPRDHRYLGFITKHPTLQRFACHVFRGHESTRPVAEAVGRAFQRFYQKFIETAYPIEDIYIE